jgi:hypothetical protein
MKPNLIIFIAAFVLGMVAYHIFLAPEVTETVKWKTRTKTDTTYQRLYTEVKAKLDSVQDLSDSIDYYQNLYQKELGNIKLVHDTVFQNKPFEAPLRRYNGLEVHLYGTTRYNALVAGNLLDLNLNSVFDVPEITNTVHTTETITRTIEPKGSIWVGGLVSQDIQFTGMAAYQKRNWKIVYQYDLAREQHSGGVMFNLFGR